ncbi:imidazole glycerol phosphate synthase subunit HisF [Hellea sp.]|nr:imidazole glycerol phosphate synthase subunit HisF [Hellea sp.]MDA9931932.1 imidazole glycerol phosphate synthase subunit HisF [bacterium]MDA8888880.1 imidazole glycerol phosphate synthase subunit HisF [Hellea sp.]MDB4844492.1 imidazole glycerol phosphate synthase subunit HisF [Hellea sp.]MDC0421492.1 imidazole glycerol phosphate synthase subunit HisF [Hellea sp.]MDC0650460.1 imidazole glycerol phosphate synthase subunit HisF [Hellea sp.]
MLAKRVIPCLDVLNGLVVKGVQFKNHKIVGDIIELASRYAQEGADELVFYDIGASVNDKLVSRDWISQVSQSIDIPFCVAGGINSVKSAEERLAAGADKISINSPAIQRPGLINELTDSFGKQCVVIGIDTFQEGNKYRVKSFTGDPNKTKETGKITKEWVEEVISRGAGEIVLNCMNKDGVKQGYDIEQLSSIREICTVPLIASGGAGTIQHFIDVFKKTNVDGALAASVFHKSLINIQNLKEELNNSSIEVRL